MRCDALGHVSSIFNMAARRADEQVISGTHAIQNTAILSTKQSLTCRAVTRPASEVTSSSNPQISSLGLLPPLVRGRLVDRPNDDSWNAESALDHLQDYTRLLTVLEAYRPQSRASAEVAHRLVGTAVAPFQVPYRDNHMACANPSWVR